jgi:hypothetical protein
MSISNLLQGPNNEWANLYLNTLNVSTPNVIANGVPFNTELIALADTANKQIVIPRTNGTNIVIGTGSSNAEVFTPIITVYLGTFTQTSAISYITRINNIATINVSIQGLITSVGGGNLFGVSLSGWNSNVVLDGNVYNATGYLYPTSSTATQTLVNYNSNLTNYPLNPSLSISFTLTGAPSATQAYTINLQYTVGLTSPYF